MSGKRRSAFAVYKQLQKETPQEHAEEERAVETSMECNHTTPTPAITADGSPEASVEGKKRKAGNKKAVLKKKKLLAGVTSHDKDDGENEKKGSNVKLSKHAKLKHRRKQLKMSIYRRKVAKEAKRKKRKVVPEDINMVAMVDGDQEVDAHGGEGSQDDKTPAGGSGTLPSFPTNLDLPFHSQFNPDDHQDSQVAARELFRLLISPLSMEKFYSDVWEEKPLLLRRHKPHYNDGWFSSKELDCILRKHYVEYTTNIDITSYENGKRQTHNPTGRAHASGVWEFYKEGCSVRLLNPQTFSQSMWLLNSTLQEHFNSCVGANVYLTPAHSQGFAPHYDDIEAFVLQLEGKKHWRLYSPRDDSEVLPRYSSCNFSQDEIGEPILDAILEPGDLLYFPRGTIHQAFTPSDTHSLHVTLSTCQLNSWGDLLEKLVPAALQVAMSEDVEFRRALPLDYLDYMGLVNADIDDPRRKVFLEKITRIMSKLIQYAPVDGAADQMGANHLHNCLPPCLTEKEQQSGMWGKGARWEHGEVKDDGTELTGSTRVKLVRHGVARLVLEEESPVLYHNLLNSRVYHEKDKQGIIINQEDAPAVEYLVHSYPRYVTVDSLPMGEESTEDKVELCQSLYSQGLLLIES